MGRACAHSFRSSLLYLENELVRRYEERIFLRSPPMITAGCVRRISIATLAPNFDESYVESLVPLVEAILDERVRHAVKGKA